VSIAIHCLSGVFVVAFGTLNTWSGCPSCVVIQFVADWSSAGAAGCTATEIASGGSAGLACFEPLL